MSDTHPIVPLPTPDVLEGIESIDDLATGRGNDEPTNSVDGLGKLKGTGQGGSQSPPAGGGDAGGGDAGGGGNSGGTKQ